MKFLKIILVFVFTSQMCLAQDTTIVLSANMLDKVTNQINLSYLDGWSFKQGTDTGSARINTGSTAWIKLNPGQLTSAYKDKNGRVEGWFRMLVKFDSTLLNKQLAFDFPKWAATELYMDGKLVASRGNMGNNGKPFLEYTYGEDPFALRFENTTPHIMMLHFAGYVSPLPPYDLKASNPSFLLLGPDYYYKAIKSIRFFDSFIHLWVFACAVLSLLFWLLYLQTRQEKNLFWIALSTTVLTLSVFCVMMLNSTGISYLATLIYIFLSNVFIFCFLIILIPFLLTKIFKRIMNKKLLIVLAILFALILLMNYLPDSNILNSKNIQTISIILSSAVCLYYIVSSWKKLKGAQWAIVVGLAFSIFSFFIIIIFLSLFKGSGNSDDFLLPFFTCFILSLPLSLLVYVSLRFKEIIKEVQLNANRVVELSEEKKLHAENQQQILQEEVNKQTAELRNTLSDLKSAQSQLIQSEKMASLGELTAGIAHEIQNPLNFVNNFSEVNIELIDEAGTEIDKGNIDEVKFILNDIKENEQKINHHGKRADAIVKGMLQHSQATKGQKEPTDIHALCDEYLRLSYHGLRGKDKSFNATFKTDFDHSIGKINIIPQDIGRVILNLINNAFYAVGEKEKAAPPPPDLSAVVEGGIANPQNDYEPTVIVKTSQNPPSGGRGAEVVISVTDNGSGIPQNIIDKIFQPFFTTKPTGQGTGLGLSLSYDIIKAHGGEITVESEEGEGTRFIIELPNQNI